MRPAQDDLVLLEVLEVKGVLPALVDILRNMSPDQPPEARLAQVRATSMHCQCNLMRIPVICLALVRATATFCKGNTVQCPVGCHTR